MEGWYCPKCSAAPAKDTAGSRCPACGVEFNRLGKCHVCRRQFAYTPWEESDGDGIVFGKRTFCYVCGPLVLLAILPVFGLVVWLLIPVLDWLLN